MSVQDEIHTFVQALLTSQDDRRPLADNDSLLISGRLQSIDVVEIVIFLEDRFGIDLAELGFDREQLDSIDAIASLIQASAASN